MKYLFIDFETHITSKLRLNKMRLRDYLAQTHITYLCWALDDGPIRGYRGADIRRHHIDYLRALMARGDVCVVAHNASFDARCIRYLLDLPFPARLLCSMELAGFCWPNQPGGYSLSNLAQQLGLPYQKGTIDFATASDVELGRYCRMDVEVLRALFTRELERMPDQELQVCRLSNSAKSISLEIDAQAVDLAADALSKVAGAAALRVAQAFDDPEVLKAYGWHGDEVPETIEEAGAAKVKSVKPAAIKEILMNHFAMDWSHKSISVKKINPIDMQAMAADARNLINETSTINKALSHGRRLRTLSGVASVDAELTYAAAHTLRFSSKNQSKGINLHNLPKHDKRVAEPLRRCIRLPSGHVFVRADLANVEYRGECLITRCAFGTSLFERDPFADPYSAFGTSATGVAITKEMAVRQLFKAAVLGLGYLMGIQTWLLQLVTAISDPEKTGICLADLEALAVQQRWTTMSPRTRAAVTKLKCPPIVGIVGEKVREQFHDRHPEFSRFGRWLEGAVSKLSYTFDVERALESLYAQPGAPDRNLLELSVDRSLGGVSVRARVGHWPASVCWRDLAIRETPFGPRLTSVLAGSKPPRAISPNILIENCVQHWARNALVAGQLKLRDLGWEHQLTVHDEVLLVCPATLSDIARAKRDLVQVFGPGNGLGYSWAVLIKPDDVCVSQSMYEDEKWNKIRFWPALAKGDESVLREVA